MRGIKIDSTAKTITEVEVEKNLDSIYKTIGAERFDVIYLDDNYNPNVLFVDDEGLLKNPEHFFVYDGYDQPLAGNGLILGSNEDGENTDTELSVEQVWNKVVFITCR